SVGASEIRSLLVIGGTPDYPNSTFIDQVTVDANTGVDLVASIRGDAVVPSAAPDLNLFHIFGTEQVDVPVTIENQGSDRATGKVTITVYLSESPDLSDQPTRVGRQSVAIDLGSSESDQFTVTVTVPGSRLTAGHDYYVVVKIVAPKIKESDSANGTDENN